MVNCNMVESDDLNSDLTCLPALDLWWLLEHISQYIHRTAHQRQAKKIRIIRSIKQTYFKAVFDNVIKKENLKLIDGT